MAPLRVVCTSRPGVSDARQQLARSGTILSAVYNILAGPMGWPEELHLTGIVAVLRDGSPAPKGQLTRSIRLNPCVGRATTLTYAYYMMIGNQAVERVPNNATSTG